MINNNYNSIVSRIDGCIDELSKLGKIPGKKEKNKSSMSKVVKEMEYGAEKVMRLFKDNSAITSDDNQAKKWVTKQEYQASILKHVIKDMNTEMANLYEVLHTSKENPEHLNELLINMENQSELINKFILKIIGKAVVGKEEKVSLDTAHKLCEDHANLDKSIHKVKKESINNEKNLTRNTQPKAEKEQEKQVENIKEE
jgi:hypothetical protein